MPFEFQGKAEIKHLNIRKGASDDSQVSIDIKLAFEGLALNTAATALGCENPDELKRALFRSVAEDAEETARFFGLSSLSSNAKWEEKHAVTIGGFRRLRCHSVRGVDLIPRRAGLFDGSMQITIQQPPAGFVENLAEHLNGTVKVHLEHDAELPLEGGDSKPKAPKQTSMKLSRHDTKLGRKDAGKELRGNSSRPRSEKKPKAA
ncbi:hypothetical protein [Lysobacter fragariae]